MKLILLSYKILFSLDDIMSSAFCYAQPKNSLAKDVKIKTLVEKIVQKVADIPQYKEYKNNIELLKMVCCIVEQEIDNRKSKAKLDKKDIVYQVYTRCWTLTPVDLKDLEANIQYLWENGQIKRKHFFKVLIANVCDWFNRRIL